jgi:hypothetical protein
MYFPQNVLQVSPLSSTMLGRVGQFSRLGHRHMSSEVKTVTLIPGDGIGPEIAKSVQK